MPSGAYGFYNAVLIAPSQSSPSNGKNCFLNTWNGLEFPFYASRASMVVPSLIDPSTSTYQTGLNATNTYFVASW
jgi:hypothetical protein